LVCNICLDKVEDYLKNNPENLIMCDDCQQVLSLIQINKIMRKGLDTLRVSCPSNDVNCLQQIQLKDIKAHLESCKYYKGNGKCISCGMICSLNVIENHIRNCSDTPYKCKFCFESIKKKLLQEHETTCSKKPTKCNLCSIIFDDTNINHHPSKDVCSINLVNDLRKIFDGKIT